MNNMNSSEVGLGLILTTDDDREGGKNDMMEKLQPSQSIDGSWSFEWGTVARKCLWSLWNHSFCIDYWLNMISVIITDQHNQTKLIKHTFVLFKLICFYAFFIFFLSMITWVMCRNLFCCVTGVPCITDCVMAELEKLGMKFRVALR